MAKLYNLARVNTATVGLGNVTLGAAVSGYLTWALAGIQDGDVVSYALHDFVAGALVASEAGRATYTAATNSFSRDTVLDSTNGGAKINLSGSAQAIITVLAEDIATLDGVLNTNLNADLLDGLHASAFQTALGYTAENSANKVTSISGASTDVQYPSAKLLFDQLALKQAALTLPFSAANGGTGIANGASATLTLPNLAITLGGGGAAQTYTLPAVGGTFALLNAANVFTAAQKINVNSTTAFLVEQDGVKDNVFVVDTTNGRVGILTDTPLWHLDVKPSGGLSTLHLSGTGADDGTYIQSTNAFSTWLTAGVAYNGSNWIAKSTSCYVFGGTGAQGAAFYLNTGLTVGNAVSLTQRFAINSSGNVSVGGTNFTIPSRFEVIGTSNMVQSVTRSFSSQVVNIQELQKSDGTAKWFVAADFTQQNKAWSTSASTIKNVLSLYNEVLTAATGAANGFGVGLLFGAETATDGTSQQQGLISTSWIDATNASRKAKLSLSAYDTAARLGLEIEASGTAVKIGLYGVATVARATNAGAAGAFVANTSGIVDDSATFGGYTIGQIAQALINIGILT